jgi:hypothetical protein
VSSEACVALLSLAALFTAEMPAQPSIGDIRSRLIRLIPRPLTPSDVALKRLLEHRLPATRTSAELKAEWLEIVEGHSNLWRGVRSRWRKLDP